MDGKLFNSMLVFITACGLVVQCSSEPIQSRLDFYRIRSFMPEGNVTLDHFAVHETSGNIYIGGLSHLYHLNRNFDQVSVVTSNSSIENINKILIIAPTIDRLITCGSFNRACQLRNLADISDVIDRLENVVAPDEYSSVGVVVPGVSLDFYVAQTIIEDTRAASRLLCIHTVSESSFTACSEKRRTSAVRIASIASGFESQFTFSFVHGNNFTYFLASQDSSSGESSGNQIVPKISRICHQENENLETFTELTLECTSGSTAYTIIKAAEVVGDQLFAVFVKNDPPLTDFNPVPGSALCIYNMTDLVMAFDEAVVNCACSSDAQMRSNNNYLDQAMCRPFKNLDCEVRFPDQSVLQCENNFGNDVYRYPAGITPFSATAVIENDSSSFSSVQVFTIDGKSGAFIGTEEGKLLKIYLEDAGSAHVYEEIMLNSPIRSDSWINDSEDSIIVLTKDKLMKLEIVNCSQYQTCDECIRPSEAGEGDPFCGWCILEKRCSRLSDCPMADNSTRWLHYKETQCVAVKSILPSDQQSIEDMSHQISLNVLQLPELAPGESYQCTFGDGYISDASVSGHVVNCTTPPKGNIPPISNGAFVKVDLHIFSSETGIKFLQTDFYFYDCNRIQSCIGCVTSPWACDWCVYDHLCTHDSSGCQLDDIIIYGEKNPSNPDVLNVTASSEQCPQIVPSESEIFVPVDVLRAVTFNAKNIPAIEKTKSYECVFTTVTGQNIDRTPAVLMIQNGSNVTNITCENAKYAYSENVQEMERFVTLGWDNDNKVDQYQPVTLYKCAVDRPDCSRCLSPITSESSLQCGWCGGTCNVKDHSDCVNSWLPQGMSCGAPTIQIINPNSGPIEGGTLVTIGGKNLGQNIGEIQSITVAGLPCSLEGLESMYKVGESISCKTSRSSTEKSGAIVVSVNSEVNRNGDVTFTYQDPKVTSIVPLNGPEAGGTTVTITGNKLRTGRKRNVTIGDIACEIKSSTETDKSFDCITSPGTKGEATVVVSFDGAERTSPVSFTYVVNPNVTDIDPKKTIKAGGNYIKVTGHNLNIVKEPRMLATFGGKELQGDVCENITNTSMICKSPPDPSLDRSRRQTNNNAGTTIGFIMDGVNDLRRWSEMNDVIFSYVVNPEYTKFKDDAGNPVVYNPDSNNANILPIKGKNLNLGSTKEDVIVFIGREKCEVSTLSETELFCRPPAKRPQATDRFGNTNINSTFPLVTVLHGGNLVFNIGSIMYNEENLTRYILFGLIGLIVLICLIFFFLYCQIKSGAEKERKEMERMLFENSENTRGELKTLYTLQQTAMDNFSTQVEDQPNLPIVSEDEYISNMLFLGQRVQPLKSPPEDPDGKIEKAMSEFSKLLNNRDFLKVFISTLDGERNLPMMDRVNIASLITLSLVLEGKLEYFTEVMTSLMQEQIEDSVDANRPKQLYRLNENIVEKMVSNWVSLCMYSYLKTNAAESLYELYGGIKCVCEKGPIDAVTGKSQFSLSDEHMLDTLIPFEEITLQVLANEEDGEKISISVLNVDTITQVKNKILDYLFRGRPYSQRPQGINKDLEWRQGINGQLILRDEYDKSKADEFGWKRLNKLDDYKVSSGCLVALVNKQANPNAQLTNKFDHPQKGTVTGNNVESYEMQPTLQRSHTLIEAHAEEGIQLYHLTQEQESNEEVSVEEGGCCGCFNSRKKSKQQYRRIREVVLPLMPLTRDAIQKSVDKAFDAMLSKQEIPPLIKHLFEFFDHQAHQHSVDVPEVVNAWKNNVLPLRFWTTVLANPTYIFDVRSSRYVEACLRVLVQMIRDACAKVDIEYTKDSSPSRLLYAKTLPMYSEKVMQYYTSVQDLPRVNPDVLSAEFSTVCKPFQQTYNSVSTLYQLFDFVRPYHEGLIRALEEDTACHNANLAYRMQEVCHDQENE